MRTAGVVLAAGAGRRFGGPKALAVIDGELLVDRAVRLLLDAGCDPVIAVLGAAAEEVFARARLDGASPVIAADWADGMSASLRAGLTAAAGTAATAVIVTLVDQPWIGVEAARRLIAAGDGGAEAVVATYDGRPGHPVLLSRGVWAGVVASLAGDVGAREWLRAHPEQVVSVPCDGTGSPADVDTMADLAGQP
jgi:CTP:molybdopterin cytidylyltransferase MocA